MYSKKYSSKEKVSNSKISQPISNPIDSQVGFDVSSVESLSSGNTINRLYAGYNHFQSQNKMSIDYNELFKNLSIILQDKNNVMDMFYSMHNLFSNMLGTYYTALGICNNNSNCINLNLIDKIGGTYTNKIFLSDENHPFVKCYNSQEVIYEKNNLFLKIPYLQVSETILLPISTAFNNIGVLMIGQNINDINVDFFKIMTNYLALFIDNIDLKEKIGQGGYTDTLTNLYTHRRFQELLAKELKTSKEKNQKLSVVMFDVNNISQINKELGHAKGDEIIKTVAEKISQNIRNNDIAGRYGGDEIAVIFPNTDEAEAKYLAEYITYALSSCFIDDVGPIKVSVGIATSPNVTSDQEKLLILAEQAMFISKSNGYSEGMSSIISSSDFNFWDDMALSSFANILTKRHAAVGINFEEELIQKFHAEENLSQHHILEVVTSLAAAIDAKDAYTKGHSTSVSRYSVGLAHALNLPEKDVERIKLGAMLHDIGKIGIPEHILTKPSQLTNEEWEIMKQHPIIGATKVLQPIESLHDLIPIVKYHHEHYDGTGYPEKLKGEEIPYAARIVAIADAYHALVSDRPYRKGLGIDKACEILKLGAGIQWDKEMVRKFIEIAPSLTTKV